jgi:hypothetical protein
LSPSAATYIAFKNEQNPSFDLGENDHLRTRRLTANRRLVRTMSTMTSDFFYPDRQAIPQSQRDWLRNYWSPPNDTCRIWIAPYRRDKWVNRWSRNLMAISSEEHVLELAA